MTRRVLSIDIETFSSVDLTKSGAHAYAAAPDFEILLFGYAFDDEPVTVIDLAQDEALPSEVFDALTDPEITKAAWNAAFERACIARHFSIDLDPDQWSCSMAHALYLGYPAALGEAAKALDMPLKKDTAGRSLIRLFCSPGKPNLFGGRGRTPPYAAPDQWAQFIEYCRRDVEVEREIRKRLSAYPLPEIEARVWAADQRINDRGIRVDLDLASRAIECDELSRAELLEEAERVTGLRNPNSPAQLKEWIKARTGEALISLDKAAAGELIRTTDDPAIRRALELRLQLGKSSVAKYQAIDRSACPDGRARGLMQYYGAARTGRWGGRRIQPQNLPRTRLRDLDAARNLVLAGDYESIDLLFGDTASTLSELVRTALIASPGCQLISADFSAIEARVLAWLAGEEWVLDVFRSGGGIYEATAAQMYRVPLDSIHRGHPLRERGKVATLACGYGGGVNALIAMGALRSGLEERELKPIVDQWRQANPRIVQYWRDVEAAALSAIAGRPVELAHGVRFFVEGDALKIRLPSGRALAYLHPEIEPDPRFGKESITYGGLGENNRWSRLRTYGGKLVENITQAVARDCLAKAILRVEAEFPEAKIVLHVHDEIVADVPLSIPTDSAIERIVELMAAPMPWAPDLPLDADAFATPYYRAD